MQARGRSEGKWGIADTAFSSIQNYLADQCEPIMGQTDVRDKDKVKVKVKDKDKDIIKDIHKDKEKDKVKDKEKGKGKDKDKDKDNSDAGSCIQNCW